MTLFDDRERAFEAKFASDQTLEFKAQAKRDRMLAEWAGAKLGMSDEALQDYILEVWREDLKHAGDEDVFLKIIGDFDRRGLHISAEDVRHTMSEFLARAREEVQSGG